MNEANNNAIDLLLRSLARGERDNPRSGVDSIAPVGNVSGMASAHLDADELSLYAEGVLAPPTKARYTAHLADCARCRTLVVGLAQSVGLKVQREPAAHPGGRSFWQSMVTLFSLPVLRYAFPAVLLTGVIAIGLMAWRQQARSTLVAVNQQAEPAAAFDQARSNSGDLPTNASTPPVQEKPGADVNLPAKEVGKDSVSESGVLQQKPASDSTGITLDGNAQQDPAKASPMAGAGVGQPVYAPDPATPPPPPAKVAAEPEDKSMARKDDYSEREAAKRNQDDFKLASKDDSPRHGPSRSRAMPTGGRRDEDLNTENRAPALKEKKKEANEESDSQTVSGRTFRRSGNAWIDTAYNSSRTLMNVGRGTEHFRTLMADEPGLRTIVQQLGGEVIVVWKNRAYRIR